MPDIPVIAVPHIRHLAVCFHVGDERGQRLQNFRFLQPRSQHFPAKCKRRHRNNRHSRLLPRANSRDNRERRGVPASGNRRRHHIPREIRQPYRQPSPQRRKRQRQHRACHIGRQHKRRIHTFQLFLRQHRQ